MERIATRNRVKSIGATRRKLVEKKKEKKMVNFPNDYSIFRQTSNEAIIIFTKQYRRSGLVNSGQEITSGVAWL